MAGRPPLEFTDEQVAEIEELARQGCQTRTIASITGIQQDTLKNHFSSLLRKQRALHKQDIRKAQLNLLHEGNATMAIWLGKQRLDQKDKQEIEQNQTIKLYGVEAPIDEV